MMKRVAAGVLVASMLLAGCGQQGKVTEDKPGESKATAVTSELPDPSQQKVQQLTILTQTAEYDRNRYEAAFMIQKALAQLGVDSEVKPTDQKVVTDTARNEPWNFDAYFLAWGKQPDRIDPQTFLYSMFHSSEAKHLGTNRQGYKNAEYDKLADQQMREMDPEKRRQLIFKLQEMLAQDLPTFPLWTEDSHNAYSKERLEGVVVQGGMGIFNNLTFINAKVKQGENIIRIAHRQDNDLLNPLNPSIYTDVQMVGLIYDTLAMLDKDNKVIPGAAESWKIVDEKTVEVKLKPNQTFHDGKPLTAEDVAFTFNYGKKHGFGRMDSYLKPIQTAEALDPLTVRFKLSEPSGTLFTATFVGIPILPKHIWENVIEREKVTNPSKWANPKPIGSGPFKFTHWRKGEEIRLDAHKGYHTPAKVDAIIQIPYANADAVIGALELKKVDMINPDLTASQIEAVQKMSHVQLTKTADIGWSYFNVNLRRKPFSDLAFRKAMAHVIDAKAITETLFRGYATPLGAGRVITPGNTFWYNPTLPTYAADVNKARQILKDAGYRWDKDGKLYFPKQ